MSSAIARCSVLAVSGSDPGARKLLSLLGSFRFGCLAAAVSASQARRKLITCRPDLVVIDAPLPDESGIELASDLASANVCGVIVLAERSVYEAVMCRVGDDGVLTIKKPTTSGDLYQACILLAATQLKLRQLISLNQVDQMINDLQDQKQMVIPETIKSASIMFATIPILLVYPWLQKYFVKGMMIGSIKG